MIPNFALPGLMPIDRPRLDRQQPTIELKPHRRAHSHWAGFRTFDGEAAGIAVVDDLTLVYDGLFLSYGGVLELATDSLPWLARGSEADLTSVVMMFDFEQPSRYPDDVADRFVLRSGSAGSGEGSLEITDAAGWLFKAPAQPVPLRTGHYKWEIKGIDSTNRTWLLYAGTMNVED